MVFKSERSFFVNTLLCIGLFQAFARLDAIPIPLLSEPNDGIKYPIHVACECMFTLYVDGKYVGEGNKENYVSYGLTTQWNDTKKYYPIIYENEPKIVAFNGIGGQYPVFPNGFIMDMNHGKYYTKNTDWKCKDFSSTISNVPPDNWFTFDYDDSDWSVAASFGENYQNNSFQIFEMERSDIHLQAEWLWTNNNAAPIIYCRKKNENAGSLPPMPIFTSMITATPTTATPTAVIRDVTSNIVPKTIPISAPHIAPTSAPHIAPTSAPHIAPTSAPHIAPHIAPTSAPHIARKNIIISPHINIIIQNIKYSQKRSYRHIDNLIRKLKEFNDDYLVYRERLFLTRYRIQKHYNTILRDIRERLQKKYTDKDQIMNHSPKKRTVHFIRSMQQLDKSIKNIEHSIQFIKGNHKYILLSILRKLKLQYHNYTLRLLHHFTSNII